VPSARSTPVLRHELFFRAMHWMIFIEGVILTLTGMQLGGILGLTILPSGNLFVHVVVGFTFVATAVLFIYSIFSAGDYGWIALGRIPYSFWFILSETKGWFGVAPRPPEPMLYDPEKKRYTEKFVPSLIVVFWVFVLLGVVLAVTGLALEFPAQLSIVYGITDFVGGALTGVTGLAMMLLLHRLAMYVLVALVAAHIYASFVFKLVQSVVTGKRNETTGFASSSAYSAYSAAISLEKVKTPSLLRTARLVDALTFLGVILVSPVSVVLSYPLGVTPQVWLELWVKYVAVFIVLAIVIAALGLEVAGRYWLEVNRRPTETR